MIEMRTFSEFSDADLASAWTGLEDRGACPSLFSSHVWVSAWSRQFALDSAPAILVGYDGSRPVGLAPLFVAGGTVEFPVNFLSLRGEFLLSGEQDDAFVAAVLRHLRERGWRAWFRSVPKTSRSFELLTGHSRSAGYYRHERPSRVSPYLDIATTWEEFLAALPHKRTSRWERQRRKLRRAGEVVIHRYQGSTDVDWLVGQLADVESRSWKERQGTSIRGRGLETFYHDLCRALAHEGWLRPVWLELDGRIVAFVLGVVFQGTYFVLKTAYDESCSKLSPGVCLFYETVGDAFRAGLSRVDFLGEPARWKSEWATGQRQHVIVALYPRGLRGLASYIIESRGKPLARRVLGRG